MKNAPPVFSSGASAGSPLGFLQSLLGSIRPPDWMVDELQNRVVLFLNHVLMSEPQALERLKRQQGKPVKVVWGDFQLSLAASPAGLLERPAPDAQPQLSVVLTQTSPFVLAQAVLSGDKPAVDIQGDVQLAAEVAWLVDNVRWDVEEDLSRVFGDAVAHTLGRLARGAAQAVKGFVPPKAAAAPGTDGGSAP
jgi:ubiquinone biosynthesis protein UbiJ